MTSADQRGGVRREPAGHDRLRSRLHGPGKRGLLPGTEQDRSGQALVAFKASEQVSFRGGYDNRKRIRLYRDFVNPETEFDDSTRQGVWVGADLDHGRHFRLSLPARVFFSVSVERNDGDLEDNDQAYASLSYRF